MNRLLFALLLLVSLTNCKKIKEDITEKKVLDFITDGRWKVTEFSKNSISYTADFTGFEFHGCPCGNDKAASWLIWIAADTRLGQSDLEDPKIAQLDRLPLCQGIGNVIQRALYHLENIVLDQTCLVRDSYNQFPFG